MRDAESPDLIPVPWGTLRTVLLLVWALATFGSMYFARDLAFQVFGWPLGLWLGSQGLMLLFVAIVAVFAWASNRDAKPVARSESP